MESHYQSNIDELVLIFNLEFFATLVLTFQD